MQKNKSIRLLGGEPAKTYRKGHRSGLTGVLVLVLSPQTPVLFILIVLFYDIWLQNVP